MRSKIRMPGGRSRHLRSTPKTPSSSHTLRANPPPHQDHRMKAPAQKKQNKGQQPGAHPLLPEANLGIGFASGLSTMFGNLP